MKIYFMLYFSTSIPYTVNTTFKWLSLNEMFRSPICKSSLAGSLAPYWMINGVILGDPTVNSRYGAEINRTNDSKGQHQAEIVVRSVNATLDGSNVSCVVGSELRMVYIIYIIDPGTHVCNTYECITYVCGESGFWLC
jgi:hypothetical protein